MGTTITIGGATGYVHVPGTLKVGGGFGSGPLKTGSLNASHKALVIPDRSSFIVAHPAVCGNCNLSLSVSSNVCTIEVISAGTAQYVPGDKFIIRAEELPAGLTSEDI